VFAILSDDYSSVYNRDAYSPYNLDVNIVKD